MDPDPDFTAPQHSLISSLFFVNIENLSSYGDTRLFFVELSGAGGARSVEQDQAGVRGCGLSSAAIRLMLHGRIQQLHTQRSQSSIGRQFERGIEHRINMVSG
jgi:hypothetical protein